MDDKISINQETFNHFLIEKLIELKTENSVLKYQLNTMLLKANPSEMSLIEVLNKTPKKALDILKFQATQSITDDLRIVSNDFDDLIQNLLNP